MAITSVAVGRFTSAVTDVVIRPRTLRAHAPVCAFLNSNTGSVFEAVGGFYPSMTTYLQRIVDQLNVAIVAPTCPTGTYGNGTIAQVGTDATCQGRLNDAIAYHKANLQGDPSKPIILLGLSAGSTGALRRAGLDPGNVGCVVTFMNVADLTSAYTNDVGGQRAGIGTAYGVTYPTSLPANTCPTHQLTDTVPKLLTHGDTDGYNIDTGHVTETEWVAGGAAAGRSANFIIVPGMAHGVDGAISGVSVDDVVNFIRPFAYVNSVA